MSTKTPLSRETLDDPAYHRGQILGLAASVIFLRMNGSIEQMRTWLNLAIFLGGNKEMIAGTHAGVDLVEKLLGPPRSWYR